MSFLRRPQKYMPSGDVGNGGEVAVHSIMAGLGVENEINR